jgi:hypothetical protein
MLEIICGVPSRRVSRYAGMDVNILECCSRQVNKLLNLQALKGEESLRKC